MDGLDLLPRDQRALGRGSALRQTRKAILVLGMDRSGTSLITHVLHTLGAALPSDLIGPSRGNPLGHWEPRALVVLNDEILGRLGRRWDDPRPLPEHWFSFRDAKDDIRRITAAIERGYAEAPLLVIKDPRLCRLLPLYLEALDNLDIEPLMILQVRPMAEVAQSLVERDGLPTELSELLWLRSVVEAERCSRRHHRVWVSFAQVLADWREAVDRIEEKLKLTWPTHPDDAADQIGLLLDHRPRRAADFAGSATSVRVWNSVRAGLAGDESAARDGFDQARASLAETDRLYFTAMSQLVGRLEAELNAMRTSTCWRLTKPLRMIKQLVGGVVSARSRLRPVTDFS